MEHLSREEIKEIVNQYVYTAKEAAEALNITSQRLYKIVKDGRLRPIKEHERVLLYFKGDIDELAKELRAGRVKYRPYE